MATSMLTNVNPLQIPFIILLYSTQLRRMMKFRSEVEEVLDMYDSSPLRLRNYVRWPLAAPARARVHGAGTDQGGTMTLLRVSVTDGEDGPRLVLSGEADLTTLGQLNSALDAHLHDGARCLTVDVSGLRYADSASITALVRAGRALRAKGGELELLHPQPAVARILSLTGVDQLLVVRGEWQP